MYKSYVSTVFVVALFATIYATELTPYKIDTNHSNVGFAVSIMGGLSEVHGKFSKFSVELLVDEKDITKSRVKAVIKAASVDTGIDARDKHLKTADFFDVEKYPDIVFESKEVKKTKDGFVAVGDLSFHGVTKEISLPFRVAGVKDNKEKRRKNIGYVAKMVLNRKDFRVNWQHRSVPDFVGDDVTVNIHVITRLIKY